MTTLENKTFEDVNIGYVMTPDQSIWFDGHDICTVLGYPDVIQALEDYVSESEKCTLADLIEEYNITSIDRPASSIFITELGVNELYARSFTTAHQLFSWVHSEVRSKKSKTERDDATNNEDLYVFQHENGNYKLLQSPRKEINKRLEEMDEGWNLVYKVKNVSQDLFDRIRARLRPEDIIQVMVDFSTDIDIMHMFATSEHSILPLADAFIKSLDAPADLSMFIKELDTVVDLVALVERITRGVSML